MGLSKDEVELVNRDCEPRGIRYDGQDMTLEPNYNRDGTPISGVRNMVPRVAVPYAKNQNVVMESEDAIDPSAFESHVGVKAGKGQTQKDDISFLPTDRSKITRVPLRELIGDSDTIKPGRGPHRMNEAFVPMPGGGGIAGQAAD